MSRSNCKLLDNLVRSSVTGQRRQWWLPTRWLACLAVAVLCLCFDVTAPKMLAVAQERGTGQEFDGFSAGNLGPEFMSLGDSQPDVALSSSTLIPEPATGSGLLHLTIETVQEKNPRMYSRRAEHVEIWWRDQRLASLYKGNAAVQELRKRRVFQFPALQLPVGYHFLQIRLYGEGWLSRQQKWKGENLQLGIHPGQALRIHRVIPFHIW